MNIQTVTVVGANGTMGANVAGIFASFGAAKVYLVSRSLEKSIAAAQRACYSVRADSIMSNLVPVDYSSLEECVRESDLVFESTAEDLNIKIDITTRLGQYLRPGAIACTGSSGLSIKRLSECLDSGKRDRYFGVHMFNPPYQLPLCELTASPYSDHDIYCHLKEYLSSTLRRTVVESKDLPAFLANRIGFYVMNEALQYADKYQDNGGIDYIDALLGPFTGRTMPPLLTSDFVGLDVHKAIVDNIYANTNDYAHNRFELPEYVLRLIEQNRLGRKTGEGLYKMIKNDDQVKRRLVYDIKSGSYRDVIKYSFPFALQMKEHLRVGEYNEAIKVLVENHSQEADISLRFLLRYILYSICTAEQVGYDLQAADDVMAAGFSWCPPFALIEAFAKVCDVAELMKTRLEQEIIEHVNIDHIMSEFQYSKYDYRPFFKAK